MNSEKEQTTPITLEHLREVYLPKTYALREVKEELLSIVPLEPDEFNHMIGHNPHERSLKVESVHVIQDAYVSAKFIRSHFPEEYPQESWERAMRRPTRDLQHRSVSELFREGHFQTVIENIDNVPNWLDFE